MADNAAGSPRRYVVMGVSGCGKSEIGRRLAERLGIACVEGDDDHPAANVAKMAAGTPLGDADRQEWLLCLQARIRNARQRGEGMVLSCSSLKRRYRDLLREGDPALIFIHLDGAHGLIASRMRSRPGHFMPVILLESQFLDLEPLMDDELGMRLDIECEPAQIVDQVMQHLQQFSNDVEK